jgi:hypothetical protein
METFLERRLRDRGVAARRATDGHRAPAGIRCFTLRREEDVSGVSGTGIVLEGVLFSTGLVVIHWLTPPPRGSIAIFDSLDQFLSIHVAPHPENRSVLVFDDEVELRAETIRLGG